MSILRAPVSSLRLGRLLAPLGLALLMAPLLGLGCGDDDAALEPLDASTTDARGSDPTADASTIAPEPDAGDAAVVDDPTTRAPEPGFVTSVVSFEPGACAGFHQDELPGVVFGAPRGTGAQGGGFDVVSLGTGGTIVLGFDPERIVDGPGPDFTVFENAFFASGDPARPFAEPAEVGVSADGITWSTFPCDTDAGSHAGCAGIHPVYSAPGNGISATDPSVSGGDSFDLADLGLGSVRYVKIHDVGSMSCSGTGGPGSNGFDLDAIAIVHGEPAP